jgi:hypothetical protein
LITDGVARIGQGTGNAVIAPGAMLDSQADDRSCTSSVRIIEINPSRDTHIR